MLFGSEAIITRPRRNDKRVIIVSRASVGDMRYGYTAEQIRAAEAPHLAAGEPLMARAAAAVAGTVRDLLHARGAEPGRVLLLVGSGNNGGDALFAGAALARSGCAVSIVEVGSRTHPAGRAAALQAGAVIVDETAVAAASGDVVVDGILGTGASGAPALRGRGRAVVAALLPEVTAPGGPAVVAVDIPSGIGPDDGSVPDATVLPADITVTFGGYKAGLLRSPAQELAGLVDLVDIGLSPELAAMTPVVAVD